MSPQERDELLDRVTALAHWTPEDWDRAPGGDPIARTINAVRDIIAGTRTDDREPALRAALLEQLEAVAFLRSCILGGELGVDLDRLNESRDRAEAALGPRKTHKPGENHTYSGLECWDCGQRGQITLSIEPQRASPDA